MAHREIELSAPQYEILTSTKELNLFLAGVGSGKSHLMGVKSANYIINFPKAVGLICANTYSQLSASTLSRIFAVWAQYYNLHEDIHFVVDKQPPSNYKRLYEPLKSYKNVISFSNGARVFLASLERYQSIDGLEVTWAMMDETKDTREEALKETIFARLRAKGIWKASNGDLYDHKPEGNDDVKGFNPLDVFTSPAKVSWLNDMFYIHKNLTEIKKSIFSKTDFYVGEFEDRKVVIASTYHNERNLPENYIASRRLVWDSTPGLTDMLIYASPVGKTGGEYYAHFDRDIHVVSGLKFDPDMPVHTCWDFNVVPYMPAMAIQMYLEDDGTHVIKVVKEYCLEHPKNTTGSLCPEMIFDFAGIINSIYVYGDASGRNRQTALMSKDSPKHNYDVIKAKLQDYLFQGSFRVPKSNPAIAGRRIMHNRIFQGTHKVRVEIDEKCVNFISDLDLGKEGPNGEYLTVVAKDPKTKKSYQQNGHLSDAFTYFCWYHFKHLIKIQ